MHGLNLLHHGILCQCMGELYGGVVEFDDINNTLWGVKSTLQPNTMTKRLNHFVDTASSRHWLWHHPYCLSCVCLVLCPKLAYIMLPLPHSFLIVFTNVVWDFSWGMFWATNVVLLWSYEGLLASLSFVMVTLSSLSCMWVHVRRWSHLPLWLIMWGMQNPSPTPVSSMLKKLSRGNYWRGYIPCWSSLG